MFTNGEITGVVVRELKKHSDGRGWLVEIFREDEIDPRHRPVMEYISMTEPNIARGPHEHADQADYFAFIGPSTFKIYLWDNRPKSPTFRNRMVFLAGEDAPRSVVIPPGVVHAYRNVGGKMGMVVNLPNRLFAGWGRKETVDETRHELDPSSIFVFD